MSLTKSFIAFAVLITLVATSAEAQRTIRFGGGGNSAEQIKMQLLQMEKVRKELELDEEAGKKIADIVADVRDEIRQEMREMFQDAGNFREMDEDERKEFGEKMRKMMTEVNGDAWKEISKLVNKDQMGRLNQLVLQRQGVTALLGKKLQKELEVTEEQIKKMQAKNKELREELNEEIQAAREDRDFEAMRDAQTEYRKASKEAFMKILTDKQKKKLEEMMGKEFEFPRAQRRGRGRN